MFGVRWCKVGAGRAAGALSVLLLAGCATTLRSPRAEVGLADADSAVTRTLRPGVTWTFAHYDHGPWAIHVVEIDARTCAPVLEARKPGPPLARRATTSALSADAITGINADFFMLPGGTPVGAHVRAGVPFVGPGDRPVFAATRAGWRIGTARLHGTAVVRSDTVRIVQISRSPARTSAYAGTREGATLFTRWVGDTVPADTGARVVLRVIDGDEREGRGVVITRDSVTGTTLLADGTVALHARGSAAAWVARRNAGDTVAWRAEARVGGVEAREVVGGFPTLMENGADVLARTAVNADFGPRRHPRTAIGWTADERLLLVVVDGRQAGWSDGMSLEELTWLFGRLGASHALNLDGGGSTALVVGGAVVNRPSDAAGERAVGNALVLTGCR